MRNTSMCVIGVVAAAGACSSVSAQQLVGSAFRDPNFAGNARIFDVDPESGLASNPRETNADVLVGIAVAIDGTWYGLLDHFGRIDGVRFRDYLVTIDPATGLVTPVGAAGRDIGEGDLAFNPVSGELFATSSNNGTSVLLRIDTQTGLSTLVGALPANDASALAFTAAGELYVLDTESIPSLNATLYRIDPASGAALAEITTNLNLGVVAGMAIDAAGTIFVADGDFEGTDQLMTLDPATGVFTVIGTTGLEGAFGGLAGLSFTPGSQQCPADWDGSGGVDGDDITAFFADWQQGDADIDGSGGTDGDDIAFFFTRWQAGC